VLRLTLWSSMHTNLYCGWLRQPSSRIFTCGRGRWRRRRSGSHVVMSACLPTGSQSSAAHAEKS
jgi:hypothetical protein